MSVENKRLKKLGPWPKGINNVAQDTEVPGDALRKALNIDLTDKGSPRRRKGQTSVYSGSGIRSLYSAGGLTVFAEGSDLNRLFPDDSTTTLLSGLDANNPLSYAEVNGLVFFTDGATNYKTTLGGVVSVSGLPIPTALPTLTAKATGGLDIGTYQIAITEVAADGEESGAGLAQTIEVTEGQGITVSGLPNSADAAAVNIYVSKANGKTLYHYAQITSSSATITQGALGRKLETQFADVLPAGQIMFYYKGRLWVAQNSVLWYSEPLRYGLCTLSMNFMYFPERITIAEPVLDGIYVVADRAYFLAGQDPKKMQQVVVSPDSGVEGTGLLLKPDVFNLEDVLEDTAYWFGSRGAMLGLPGGATMAIMEDRVAVPDYLSGATMLRNEDGIQQVLSAVHDPGEDSSMMMGDSASAEVVRNGVVLP